jgi:hypothetical protein
MSSFNSRDRAPGAPTFDPHVEPSVPSPSSAGAAVPPAPWSSLTVRTSKRARDPAREIAGPQRLALLYLWYRDDRSPRLAEGEVAFHPTRGAPLVSPRAVDWSGFPWADAVAAVGKRGRIPTPLSVRKKG